MYHQPLRFYEVHLGSWRKHENGEFLRLPGYGRQLAAYVKEMGYTAVELLPVTEHPLDDSWATSAPDTLRLPPGSVRRRISCGL